MRLLFYLAPLALLFTGCLPLEHDDLDAGRRPPPDAGRPQDAHVVPDAKQHLFDAGRHQVDVGWHRPDAGGIADQYEFSASISGVPVAGIATVDGIEMRQIVLEYQNGNDPLTRKRPGRVVYGHLLLSHVFLPGDGFNDWIEAARLVGSQASRREVTVTLTADGATRSWVFEGCFPSAWGLAPLLAQDGSVLVEHMELACDYFEEP